MEDKNTGAEIIEGANTGAPETDRREPDSPISGDELFQRFEQGASIDELNGLLTAGADDPEDSRETVQGSDDPEPQNGDAGQPIAGGDNPAVQPDGSDATGADANADSGDDRNRAEAARQEKKFSQRDLDYIIGRKTSEAAAKHSALLDDLASLLGVDRANVVNEVRRQRLEAEAERQGVADKELYARTKTLEAENEALQNERRAAEQQRIFLDDVERQRAAFAQKTPDFNMEEAVRDPQFTGLLGALYRNPETRDRALELAYYASFFDNVKRSIAQTEKEKVISSVKAGGVRVSEGAAGTTPAASARIDMNKLSDRQIEEIAQGVLDGKIRRPEDIHFAQTT